MNTLPLYHEDCEKCGSSNTSSYIEYCGTAVNVVCKDCGHREVSKKKQPRIATSNC